MLAAFASHTKPIVQETPRPEPGPGQALVQVLLAGICATDLELLAGYQDFHGILGHEFVGRVVQAPDHPQLIGHRVVGDINCGCGQCRWCLQGNARHCPQRGVVGIRGFNGVWAQFVCLPAANLHLVPDSVPDRAAVWAEPLAAALEISQQVHITAQSRIAVLGDGKLGLLSALALSHFSSQVILVGRHPAKLDLAAAQGVDTWQLPSGQPVPDRLLSRDLVVECTGRPQGIETALDLVRPEGTVVVKTTSHQQTSLDLARVVVHEITLLGSRCGDLSLAVRFLEHKWVDVLPLVQAVYPLDRIQVAVDLARQPGTLKVLVDCSGESSAQP